MMFSESLQTNSQNSRLMASFSEGKEGLKNPSVAFRNTLGIITKVFSFCQSQPFLWLDLDGALCKLV